MKKTGVIVLLLSSILFFANCHEKAFPTDSNKNKAAVAKPDTVLNKSNAVVTAVDTAGNATATRMQGKTIFESECGHCHDLPKPWEYNMASWDKILPEMIKKAELPDTKGQMVRAYVTANAKAW